MGFSLTTVWSGLKKLTLGDTSIRMSRIQNQSLVPTKVEFKPLDIPDVQDKSFDGSNSWSDMAMNGPCTYADFGKTFNDVLSNYKPRYLQLFKKLSDDEWKLKVGNVAKFDAIQHDLKMVMEGKTKNEHLNMTFKVANEKSLCLDSKYKEFFSFKAGVSQKMDEVNADKKLFANAQLKHTSLVMDAGVDFRRFDDSEASVLNFGFSAVVGHKFHNVGLLAAIDLAKKQSDPEWKNILQSVSFGAVFPVNAISVTLHPNTDQCSINGYWKLNDFEIAATLKNNWRSPEWVGKDNEIGLKYKHSKNTTLGIKSNLDGDVSLGLWHNERFWSWFSVFKFGLFYQNSLKEYKGIGDVGLSVEF